MKNILYFDENKLFSLMSQVFAGVTELIIKEKSKQETDSETQKGPLATGKIVADAITWGEKDTERRVMHDYAFSLFESEIIKKNLVQEIDSSRCSDPVPDVARPFVRVSASAQIFDVKKARETMEQFNALGASLGYVQAKAAVDEAIAPILATIKSTKDKQKVQSLIKQKDQIVSAIVAAASEHMVQDQRFLDNLANVTRFGFDDSLEIHQTVGSKRFTSCLKRSCLREDEALLVRKYSRTTRMNFVVLGVITNYPRESAEELGADLSAADETSLKEAVINIVQSLGNLEKTFSDVDKREYMIDPIAIYVTLG